MDSLTEEFLERASKDASEELQKLISQYRRSRARGAGISSPLAETSSSQEDESSHSEKLIAMAKEGDSEGLQRLLSENVGLNINSRDEQYAQTALSWAAEKGHMKVVEFLLEKKADVTIHDNLGHSALFWASHAGHEQIVVRLLNAVDGLPREKAVGACSKADAETIFLNAAAEGWQEVTKYFLGQADFDVNLTDSAQNTALMHGSKKGHLGIVKQLIQANADAALENEDGETALLLAIRSEHVSVLDWLLSEGKIEEEGKNKAPSDPRPLIAASTTGNIYMINALLRIGKDPWNADEDGFLPLHRATEHEHVDAFKILVTQMGDDLIKHLISMDNEKTKVYSALAIAFVGNDQPWESSEQQSEYCGASDAEGSCAFHHAALLGLLDTAKRFLDWGVDVDVLDDNQCSALFFAAYRGQSAIVEWLLDEHAHEVDVDRQVHGYTPLGIASGSGHTDVVKEFCKFKKTRLNINAVMNDGKTALMLAAERGDVGSLSSILTCNPNLEIGDAVGQTALSLAMKFGTLKTAGPLIKENADIYHWDRESKSPIIHAVERGIKYLELVLKNSEGRPRVSAIEIALRYSYRKNYADVVSFILSSRDYLNARDETGRSLLSLTAERGNGTVVELLCKNGSDLRLKDRYGRTPLSWAAVGRDVETMQALLAHPEVVAYIDESDNNEKTPLAWAAEGGHVSAVKYLLYSISGRPYRNQRRSPKQPSMAKELLQESIAEKSTPGVRRAYARLISSRDGEPTSGGIAIDSRDNQNNTPLCYAAINGHANVVDLLLDYGANPKTSIFPDVDVTEMVGRKIAELKHLLGAPKKSLKGNWIAQETGNRVALLEEIKNKLNNFESFNARIEGSAKVDGEFLSTVVDIREGQGYAAPTYQMRSVHDILTNGPDPAKDDVAVRWIHLPANNVSCKPTRCISLLTSLT